MKKFLVLLLSFIMIFSTLCVSSAVEVDDDLLSGYIQGDIMLLDGYDDLLISPNPNSPIKVKLDDKYIDFTDANGNVVNPQIINDRTMVPFRKIFNSLGVTDENIVYTSSEEPIIAKSENVEIQLQIGNTTAKKIVDGVTTDITLDSAPVIVEGRTLVPVRFIAESLEKTVGWDATNRTVIIIDLEKLQNELETAVPNYIKLIQLQTVIPTTFDISASVNGKISYTDSNDKANNTNLDIKGNIDMVKASDAISMKLDAKLSGKGVIFDTIKENNMENIDFSIIVTKDAMYMNSSLLKDQTNGKWIMQKDDSMKELFDIMNASSDSKDLLKVNEDDLTIYTYESLKMVVDLVKNIMGDDKLTITEGKTTKYEWKLDLNDLIDMLKNGGVDTDEVTNVIKKFDVSAEGTIKDGLGDSSKANMTLKVSEEDETMEIEFNADAKVNSFNKTYDIKIPASSEVFDVSEM